MSARTLHKPAVTAGFEAPAKVLPLPAGFFHIRKNGIEFQSSKAIAEFSEVTVELETPNAGEKVQCTGVVVSCQGNRHTGYQVALLFTDLSQHSQAQLSHMALAAGR